MDNIEIMEKLKKEKLISVVRMSSDKSQETIEAIIQGGIKFIEITFTMKNALEMIAYFSDKHQDDDVVIGAGTILDVVSARLAILNGAKFIVAPCFNADIAELCNLYRIPYMPGIHNPQDIETALRSGVDILKLFPASTLEPFVIKEFRGPFPQSDFIISGKVNTSNIHKWLNGGALAVCLGSVITNEIDNGFSAVVETTKAFVKLVKENEA